VLDTLGSTLRGRIENASAIPNWISFPTDCGVDMSIIVLPLST
jgi:hypothetical protein